MFRPTCKRAGQGVSDPNEAAGPHPIGRAEGFRALMLNIQVGLHSRWLFYEEKSVRYDGEHVASI